MNRLHPWMLLAPLLIVGAATLEGFWLQHVRGRYDWRAYFASLGDAAIRASVRMLQLGLATSAFGWLWATHSVHHSPHELNLAAAYRLGWTQALSLGPIFFAPLVLMGFSPRIVGAAFGLNLLYQFWLHAPWMPRLGPLEWVLNTPAHHRVHHASNPEYLDANFGGVLIIFDRWFGSLREERAEAPLRYGLVEPMSSYNPIVIGLREWLALVRDALSSRSLRALGQSTFGPLRTSKALVR